MARQPGDYVLGGRDVALAAWGGCTTYYGGAGRSEGGRHSTTTNTNVHSMRCAYHQNDYDRDNRTQFIYAKGQSK